jgi:hypothetical protein
MEITPDGRYLLTAAVSNSQNGVVLAVLDAAHIDGTSPEDPGSPFSCRDCPAGKPVAYFVMPWSDIAHVGELPIVAPKIELSASGNIELLAPQLTSGPQGPEMLLEISPSLEVVRSSFSDSFLEWHEKLEREGKLTHRATEDSFRAGFAVKEWTPKDGWRTIGPPASASR